MEAVCRVLPQWTAGGGRTAHHASEERDALFPCHSQSKPEQETTSGTSASYKYVHIGWRIGTTSSYHTYTVQYALQVSCREEHMPTEP